MGAQATVVLISEWQRLGLLFCALATALGRKWPDW